MVALSSFFFCFLSSLWSMFLLQVIPFSPRVKVVLYILKSGSFFPKLPPPLFPLPLDTGGMISSGSFVFLSFLSFRRLSNSLAVRSLFLLPPSFSSKPSGRHSLFRIPFPPFYSLVPPCPNHTNTPPSSLFPPDGPCSGLQLCFPLPFSFCPRYFSTASFFMF